MGRRLCTQLDLLRPHLGGKTQEGMDHQKQSHDSHSQLYQFSVGYCMYVRNYGPGPLWLPGLVVGLEGSALCKIRLKDQRTIC